MSDRGSGAPRLSRIAPAERMVTEDELLDSIEGAARSVCRAQAPRALEGEPMARRVARAGALVVQIAALLRRVPLRAPGDLRILRSRLRALAELAGAGDDHAARLEELRRELTRVIEGGEDLEAERVSRAFDRKIG